MNTYSYKKLYEDFIETNVDVLNIIGRKSTKYPFFNSKKLMIETAEEDEIDIRLGFINLTFDYLGMKIDGKGKEDLKLKDFIEKNFQISKSDWSSLFIKTSLFDLIKRKKIKNNIFESMVKGIGINPNKFILNDYKIEPDKVKPGDLIVWKVEKETIYLHYAIYLYEDNGVIYSLEPNVDNTGQLKKGGVNITKRKKDNGEITFEGYFNIFKDMFKELKNDKTKKRIIKKDGSVEYGENAK
jgi:hypothetical protein